MGLERILDSGIFKTALLTSILDSIKFIHYIYKFSYLKFMFIDLCSHCHYVVLQCFHHPPNFLLPVCSQFLLLVWPQMATNLLSVSIHLSFVDIRVNRIRLCVVLFIWLPSLFIILLRFICVVAWSFSLMNSTPPPLNMPHFIYSAVDGRLHCFQLVVIMNNVTVNIYGHTFVQKYVYISLRHFIILLGILYLSQVLYFSQILYFSQVYFQEQSC